MLIINCMNKKEDTNKDKMNTRTKRTRRFFPFLKQNSDLIQAICSILSVVFIGVCSLHLAKEANKVSATQFYFSAQPYFTISEIGNGGLENFQICNEGGYIQNASLELINMLEIDIYNDKEFRQTIYVPFGSNLKYFYDLKNKSFTINDPEYVMEATEMENRICSYYLDTEYSFIISRFRYIELDYLNCNHNYMEEKYLICTETNEQGFQGYYLSPLKEELMQIIDENIPDTYKKEEIDFPQGAIWRINASGRRGATRTFTDDAEQEANEIIREIDQIVNHRK